MATEVENGPEITQILGQWYDANQRSLPWRETTNPYFIWLSEIILQQTRVDQGTPYYLRFIKNYPKVEDLATAQQDDVLKLWQGLGYYSRARNVHFTANYISNDLHGQFPSSYAELIKLKGIGKYTASAIASIAFNEPVATVDGNVVRVVSRLFAISEDVTTKNAIIKIESITSSLLNPLDPGKHNQAVMEFGATHCTPVNPSCLECPLNTHCQAFKLKVVSSIPLKSKKIKRKTRYFHYLVVHTPDSSYLLHQRTNKDIWNGLYQFPLIESENDAELNDQHLKQFLKSNSIGIQKVNRVRKHVLSHQDIHARFYHLQIGEQIHESFKLVAASQIGEYPLPRLIDRYLEEHDVKTGNAALNA